MSKSRRIERERVGAVVARGEAEVGFQQISELLPEPGIDVVGPLPPEVQRVTVFSAGVAASSKNADAARALIRFLASSEAAGTVKASGLEPLASIGAPQSARAAASHVTAAIDKVLADAVARGDIPGVVAMVTDRRGIVYQGAFGVADAASGQADDRRHHFPHRVDDEARHVAGGDATRRTGPAQPRRSCREVPATTGKPQSASRTSTPKPGHTHCGPQSGRRPCGTCSLTRPGSATTLPARSCATSSRARATRIVAGPLLFDPGEQWLYSTGIDWGGRIVETLSGKNLETYFRDHIFVPLGMTDTAYNPPDDRRPRLTVVHRRRPDGTFEVGSDSAGLDRAAASWRRRACLDGVGLHPVPADAAQSGHLERRPHRLRLKLSRRWAAITSAASACAR